MKKLTLILFLLLQTAVFSQGGSAAIKLGYFDPGATAGGFIIGYEGGKHIDEIFNIGWSVDWFNKTYTDESLVEEFKRYDNTVSETVNELRARTTIHSIPAMFTVTGKLYLQPKMPLFFTGGVGAEALLIFYRNYQNPDEDEFRGAFDFNWRVGTGVAYELGTRSDVFIELAWHSANPGWEYSVEDPNTGTERIFVRSYDMSGIMLRLGVRFFY